MHGLTRSRYVWIMYGWYQDGWWRGGTECTDTELTRVVEGALALQLFPRPAHLDTLTDTGLVRTHTHKYVHTVTCTVTHTHCQTHIHTATSQLATVHLRIPHFLHWARNNILRCLQTWSNHIHSDCYYCIVLHVPSRSLLALSNSVPCV